MSPTTTSDDIAKNPTVFGQLLRRELPVSVLYEDEDYFAFKNIKPYAEFAGLVIPKHFVKQDPANLGPENLAVVERMLSIGRELVAREQPSAFATGDYWLRFHRPPFNSVDHLHLHVLAPASTVSIWTSFLFLADSPWAMPADAVLRRLRAAPPTSSRPGRSRL